MSGRLGICAPLTSRFPPLTGKRAMTAGGYGPTVPTGRYLVVDHDFGTWPGPLPNSRPSLSADCRKCRSAQKYTVALKALIPITCGNYPRLTAGFRVAGSHGGRSVPAPVPHRHPIIALGASLEAARGPRDCAPSLLTAVGMAARPSPRPGKASLRILFLSYQTELSADSSVRIPKGWRPPVGGSVQSHMGYHGDGGRRVAMRHHQAFHAIARNNSATGRKPGRPYG